MEPLLLEGRRVTNKPHDALFKSAFESPEHAAGLLQSILSAELRDAIVWPTLTREAGSFIDDELRDRHSDLLFSAEIDGSRSFLYLLLEHQSANDPDMPLRMLIYLVRIWERFRKQSDEPLPPIIPVLLSHVPGGWTAPRTFHGLFRPRPSSIPGLARLIPDFDLLIEDVTHRSDEELEALALAALPKVALWLFRDARDATRLQASFPTWARRLVEAVQTPHGLILLHYITRVSDRFSWTEFHAKIRELAPEATEEVMTIAEELIALGRAEGELKGRAEGELKGRAEGALNVLLKLLALKFGDVPSSYRALMATASLAELDTWAERVLPATSLDDVFAE